MNNKPLNSSKHARDIASDLAHLSDMETQASDNPSAEFSIMERAKARIIFVSIFIVLAFSFVAYATYLRMYPKGTNIVDLGAGMMQDIKEAVSETSSHLSNGGGDINAVILEAQKHSEEIAFDPSKTWRADIVDRNGTLLATSLPSHHLYLERAPFHNPQMNLDLEEVIANLKQIFDDFDEERFRADMQPNKGHARVRNFVTPKERNLLYQYGIPAMRFDPVFKRYYPQGMLMAHPVGIASSDGSGLSGFEHAYNEQIRSSKAPIELAIDTRLQQIFYETLELQMEKFSALTASAMLVDIRTGEILSLVSLPSFDPNDVSSFAGNPRAQRSLLVRVWEQGSTMKLLNVAIGLETGALKYNETVDARQPITIANFKINDYMPKYAIFNVPEIMIHSSNIASAKIAEKIGIDAQKRYFKKMHLLDPVKVDGLSGYDNPLYPRPERGLVWGNVENMTMGFGHGIAVSPLQVMYNYVMIASDGIPKNITLLKNYQQTETLEPVISPATAKKLQKLMRLVVRFGSARKAEVKGYQIGGKTGTANKPSPKGGYDEDRVQTSFAGIFPTNDPKYAIYIALDEPQGTAETFGYKTAGWNVVPATADIVKKIAPILGVRPITEEDDSASMNNPYSLIQYIKEP